MKIIEIKNNKNYQEQTLKVLQSGGLVIAPSDTVYGLLVDATNDVAVKKLLAFKNRPIGKPISIFLSTVESIKEHAHLRDNQINLLTQFVPGPFTIVLPSKHLVSKLLESERGTLGVRVIDYPTITNLVQAFGKPVTATSANISGKKPHHSVKAFLDTLSQTKKDLVDLVLDAGTLPRNKPSTVVDLSGSDIKLLRKGDLVMSSESSYISISPTQTMKIGAHLMKKYMKNAKKPIVFILEGDLGVGKTVLVKGLASILGIDNIISPTYVIYYEYPVKGIIYKKFVHADLYNIQEVEEFNHLGLESYLEDMNVLCFEWGERMGNLYETMKDKAQVIYIRMKHKTETEREIHIYENTSN